MNRIIKIGPLAIGQLFVLSDYKALVKFGEQDGQLFVWLLEDLEGQSNLKTKNYLIVGTGRAFEPNFIHQETVITSAGMVWHLLQEYNPLVG